VDDEDAVLGLGVDLRDVHVVREVERAVEGAKAALDPRVAGRLGGLPLAADGEVLALEGDGHVLLGEAGEIQVDDVAVLGLADVRRRREGLPRERAAAGAVEGLEDLIRPPGGESTTIDCSICSDRAETLVTEHDFLRVLATHSLSRVSLMGGR